MGNIRDVIVVGDRVLIKPYDERDKTDFGIYLPPGVQSKEKVQSGFVVKTGPGYPLPDLNAMGNEPWESTQSEQKYMPLQAKEGDLAIFLRKAAIEIEFEKEKYLVLPQAAILLLVREDLLSGLENTDDE
jgi:co-chaperonin GroES (HSP10)